MNLHESNWYIWLFIRNDKDMNLHINLDSSTTWHSKHLKWAIVVTGFIKFTQSSGLNDVFHWFVGVSFGLRLIVGFAGKISFWIHFPSRITSSLFGTWRYFVAVGPCAQVINNIYSNYIVSMDHWFLSIMVK